MKIKIDILRSKMVQILVNKGFDLKDANIIAESYLIPEIEGKTTHGLNRFIWDVQYLNSSYKPKIINNNKSVLLIDGGRAPGPLVANFMCNILIELAQRYGVAMGGIKNMTQYGSLGEWTKKISNNNLVSIITNTCQPAAAPYGGWSKVLGTNPISIGIPNDPDPIILDMSTSIYPMSLIWESISKDRNLPKDAFYDKDGALTTNPRKAKSVKIFGDYKGYGLSFMLEILSGSLIGAAMGDKIKDQFDIGYFFIVIDPNYFQKINLFKKQNKEFIRFIKKSQKTKNTKEILIPGEKSLRNVKKSDKNRLINIDDNIIKKLEKVKI